MTIMFLAHSDDITEMKKTRHRGELQNGAITSVHSLNKAAGVQGQMKNPSTIWRTKKNRIIVQTYAKLKPECFSWLFTPENVNSRKHDICLPPKFRPHLLQIIPIYGEERGRKKLNALEMELLYNMVCSGYAQTTNSSNTLNGKEELFISSQTCPLGEMAGLGICVDVLLFTACKREAELIGRACIHAFSRSLALSSILWGKIIFGAVPAVLVEMAEESGHVLV